jgi:multidrug efflux pump
MQGAAVLLSLLPPLEPGPILMTSIAFAFGSLPLAIATGADAASRICYRHGRGGGMVSATALTIL